MDLFNSFSYGRLIKTFLPGFILAIALCIYIDIISCELIGQYVILNFASENSLLFTVLLIPISIVLGVTSNIVFFTFGTNLIIEKQYQLFNPNYYSFEKSIYKKIQDDIITEMGLDETCSNGFREIVDIKSFLLNKIDVDKISFIKDSFWYYLEFQLNILLAIDFIVPAFIIILIKFIINNAIHSVLVSLIFTFIFIFTVLINALFIKSARKNYDFHQRKQLSLTIGSYYFSLKK